MKSRPFLILLFSILTTLAYSRQQIGPNLFLDDDRAIKTYNQSRQQYIPLRMTPNFTVSVEGQPISTELETGLLRYYCDNFPRVFANSYRLIYLLRKVNAAPADTVLQGCKDRLRNMIEANPNSTAKTFYLSQLSVVAQPEGGTTPAPMPVPPNGNVISQGSPNPNVNKPMFEPVRPPSTAPVVAPNTPPAPTGKYATCEELNRKRAAGEMPLLYAEGTVQVYSRENTDLTHSGAAAVPGGRSQSTQVLPLFCTDPRAAVCAEACFMQVSDGSNPTSRRRHHFHTILGIAGLTPDDLKEGNPHRLENFRKFFRAFRRHYADKFAIFPKKVEEWRQNVREMFQADLHTSPQSKALIFDRLSRASVRDESIWIEPSSWSDPSRANDKALAELIDNCGHDGMGTGAYNQTSHKPLPTGGYQVNNYIGICPGNILLIAEGNSEFDYTCTHEFCHCFDAGRDPSIFAQYESCLTGLDLRKKDGKIMQKGKHVHERTADLVAAELFAFKAKKNKQSAKETFEHLAKGLGAYCPGVGGGDLAVSLTPQQQAKRDAARQENWDNHPDADFQMLLFGRNPDLREKLGCSRTSANYPYCGRAGKYPPNT